MTKKLKDIGEFGLIEHLRKTIKTTSSVAVGIGDDAAVLNVSSGKPLLFTTDMLVEDRHFRRMQATAFQIGWKALAVNISDIAAMGGLPTHAVVSVALAGDLTLDFVEELYRGIQTLARVFKINIVGGDTNASNTIVISVALLGAVKKNQLIRRSGAKVGDVIFV